jgi:hypothetical protein
MEVADLMNALTSGSPTLILGIIAAYFINAYNREVSDHKETLKEIGMIRQKQQEVQTIVAASKTTSGI